MLNSASVLIVMERPGPKAIASRVVSQHNDDETARRLRLEDICLTNVVPSVSTTEGKTVDNKVVAKERALGRAGLTEVIQAMPNVRWIFLAGGEAQKGFRGLSNAPRE